MSRAVLEALTGEVRLATLPSGQIVQLCYRPDPASFHETRTKFGAGRTAHLAGAQTPSDWMALLACEPPLKDQVQSSGCTGHAWAYAQEVAHVSAGTPLPFHVSCMEPYRLGRAIDRIYRNGAPTTKLEDTGAMPNQVARAGEEFGLMKTKAPDGISSDAQWALDNDKVNTEPNLFDLEIEETCIPGGSYPILDCSMGHSLDDVEANVKAALSAQTYDGKPIKGLPVMLGVFVDTAFMQWTASKPAQGPCVTNDPNGGGHAIHFCGYRRNPSSGETELLIRNSWSDWASSITTPAGVVDSCIWVNRRFLATCTDLRVVVPNLKA